MAKAAKDKEADFTPRTVNGYIKKLLEQHEAIETSKGQHANRARRIQDTMTAILESAAAEGIPQKVMKTQIKIIGYVNKIKTLYEQMEAEQQIALHKVAKAHAMPAQLTLFKELPPPKIKPMTAAEKKAKADAEKKAAEVAAKDTAKTKPAAAANGNGKPATPGATGKDIDEAMVKAGDAPLSTAPANDGFKPLH